jgi:hypothetical protein
LEIIWRRLFTLTISDGQPAPLDSRLKLFCGDHFELVFRPVQILRIMLCSSCASDPVVEENSQAATAYGPVRGDFSSHSSICIPENAQVKRTPAARCASFPHFHSDGCYYGLYPSYKTGYSSRS